MNDIKFLLKFGEKEHLESLQMGYVFFSNAKTFRGYEEELFIKGQGDRLEGGAFLAVNNLTMHDIDTNDVTMRGFQGSAFIHYEHTGMLPVFCMFACFEKDCVYLSDGTLQIKLSDEIKQTILLHFPKADTVAIISNTQSFIHDIHQTIGTICRSDMVQYFNLLGFERGGRTVNDMRYYNYLSQDTPPKNEDGKTVYSFNAQYVYRALLCKDVFFEQEQEYRFILPAVEMATAQTFPVGLSCSVKLENLDSFFKK